MPVDDHDGDMLPGDHPFQGAADATQDMQGAVFVAGTGVGAHEDEISRIAVGLSADFFPWKSSGNMDFMGRCPGEKVVIGVPELAVYISAIGGGG